MKLAFFSDIHANYPALEAVLAAIDSEKPDMTFCLGDLVGYNVWPNDVTSEIRYRQIPTIAGNYDEGIGLNSNDCGCAYKTDEEKANGAISIQYTNEIVTEDTRNYLRMLPRQIPFSFSNNEKTIHFLMVHGSPRRINEYLFEDRPEKSFHRLFEAHNADIMLFGHTHKPFHRVLPYGKDGETHYRHAINIGSVGKPKDGDARACYAMLEFHNTLTNKNPDTLSVAFPRVTYDIKQAQEAIKASPLPNVYAQALGEAE